MRRLALVLSLSLLASPAFARKAAATGTGTTAKGPRAGEFCAKTAIGTNATDAKGVAIHCKAGKNGRARWSK